MQFRHYLLALSALQPLVSAADEKPIEEMVVAGYRPITVFELDTSVTLLDQQTIESATINNFEELVQLVPNMYLSGEGSRARYFQIRGVGEREQYEGAPNPSVGFIIDDIDLSGIGGVTTTFDLEQVDVLRGPQSARYGASALAGIVYTQSAMPTDELSSRVEIMAGSEDTFSAGAAVGGPLAAGLSGRVALQYYEDNGFRDNEFQSNDDTNGREELTARAKLRWELGSDWEMLLSGLYLDFDNRYDAWSLNNSAQTFSDGYTPAILTGDPNYDTPAFYDLGKDAQETKAASLKFTGPLNQAINLVSISSIAFSDIEFSFDSDWANPGTFQPDYEVYYGSYNPRERDTLSQEFRLVSSPDGRLFRDSTDWVIGVFAQRLEEDNEVTNSGEYVDAGFCVPGACQNVRLVQSDYQADSFALFAATESALTDRLGLSVGLRVERWEAEYADSWFDNGIFNTGSGLPVSGDYAYAPDETMLGGHVALSYAWSDDLRGYARVARGFKAGGFNPSLNALTDNGVTGQYGSEYVFYSPEYLWNYELGLKSLWLNGDLQADVALFYMDRDDAQLSQSDQLSGDPSGFVFVTYNGQAESYGLEANASWQVSNGWELHGALGLLQTEINTWAVRPDVEGRELAHAPPYTFNLGFTYTGMWGLFARVDLNGTAAYYYDISHDQKSDSYEVVNARIGKEWDNLSISLWGRNIFGEDYATRGFYFVNEPPYDPAATKLYTRFGEPRVVGMTINYTY